MKVKQPVTIDLEGIEIEELAVFLQEGGTLSNLHWRRQGLEVGEQLHCLGENALALRKVSGVRGDVPKLEGLHPTGRRLKLTALEDGDEHQVLAIDLVELKRFVGISISVLEEVPCSAQGALHLLRREL